MKRFLIFLCAVMLVFGMVGSASAIPILNNGIDLDDAGNLYGTYINSGSLLFTQRGNNDGNKLEGVEMLVENELGYNADDFDLTVTSMSYSSDDGGFTGLWNANPEDTLISFYAVKAGRGYAMYQVYPAEGTGSWSTYDLWVTGLYNNGADLEISHYTGYNSVPAPVPEPTTILLMGTGLLGLVGYSRKRSGKKSVTRF
ncbi:MAG: PEP-CTERM sorting domain-containing protein [Deltaproteobacteria bacterium]|nr:PEP-CTERM sorting domain-containing protein [Deltaproteobacteria bacterium]